MITLPDLLPALRALGTPPIGDPAAARAYANLLRGAAGDLRYNASGMRRHEHLDSFCGPAAGRHAADVAHLVGDTSVCAAHLDDIAARVDRDAAALEHLQHVWRTRARAAAHGAEGILRMALGHLGWKMP